MPSSWLTSPWLILLMLGVLVVVAVPISLYLWLNSDAGETQQAAQALVEPRSVPLPAPVKPRPVDVPAEAPAVPAAAISGEEEPHPVAASSATGSVVHLEFGDEAWVEVKDATGRTLHRQLNPAGSSADIRGQPPFDVLIGNAAQVRMTYNGRPIDLKPFIAVTVARFTLEE